MLYDFLQQQKTGDENESDIDRIGLGIHVHSYHWGEEGRTAHERRKKNEGGGSINENRRLSDTSKLETEKKNYEEKNYETIMTNEAINHQPVRLLFTPLHVHVHVQVQEVLHYSNSSTHQQPIFQNKNKQS